MKKRPRRRAKTGTRNATLSVSWVLLLLTGVVSLYVLWRAERPETSPGQVEAQQENRRPFYDNPEAAKPFPATMDPMRFDILFVSKAYEVARDLPEVLVQQPCDCNCGILGHRSLLDCYVSYHAATCAACLKEAILAARLTSAGRTPPEIREDIDRGLWRAVELDTSRY